MPNSIYITTLGNILFAQLMAGNGQLEITRTMVGDGQLPTGTNPETLTDLIHAKERAQWTPPEVYTLDDQGQPLENPVLSFNIQYDNLMTNGEFDPNAPGLTVGFEIREMGVFAKDIDGNEILVYYGVLGQPDYITPPATNRYTRTYAISMTLSNDLAVSLTFLPGVYILWQDLPKIFSMSANNPPQGSRLHFRIKDDVSAAYSAMFDNPNSAAIAEARQYVNPKFPGQGYALALLATIAEAVKTRSGETVEKVLFNLNAIAGQHNGILNKLLAYADELLPEVGTVSLTNSLQPPFNNSKQTITITKPRNLTGYFVEWQIISTSGGVANRVYISNQLTNTFDVEFDGDATTVVIKYRVSGGMI
jgi:hypothetical protein